MTSGVSSAHSSQKLFAIVSSCAFLLSQPWLGVIVAL